MESFLKSRLPARNEVLLALSMAAFLVFSWELRAFFYSVPAFLLSYSLGETLSIAAYMLAFALIETLVILAVALVLAFVLPAVLFRSGFSYKASLLFLALGAISIHLQLVMTNQPKITFLALELARGLGAWLAAVLLTQYIPWVRNALLDILDRMVIFAYIYLPLGALSLLVVFVRMIW